MKPPLKLADAQAQLLDLLVPLPPEDVPIKLASGRYLAAPLVAGRTQPPADLSAMDGYAVAGPSPWIIIGESKAGAPFFGNVSSGEAVRISTGALIPDGAGKVVLQEHVVRSADIAVHQAGQSSSGSNIRAAGSDFMTGDTLLAAGTRIGPAQIALTLAAGRAVIQTPRKPVLTLIDSGDELAADPQKCSPHQIPASNGAMLAAMASSLPCTVKQLGPIPDNLDALTQAFRQAEGSDLIVTSGGASVGDHDLIRPALGEWGAQIDFWRVAIKPGKPLLVARRGRQIILGLPGNPVSSFVTAFLFMMPLLRKLSGASDVLPRRSMRRVGIDLAPTGPRREFLRAVDDGAQVTPLNEQDSSALGALASATALIERPENSEGVKAGTDVPTYLIQNG